MWCVTDWFSTQINSMSSPHQRRRHFWRHVCWWLCNWYKKVIDKYVSCVTDWFTTQIYSVSSLHQRRRHFLCLVLAGVDTDVWCIKQRLVFDTNKVHVISTPWFVTDCLVFTTQIYSKSSLRRVKEAAILYVWWLLSNWW